MKSLILLSLITFVSCIQAFSEAGENKFPRCHAQTMNISRETERCMDSHGGTPLDILRNLRPVVLQYSDTDTDFSALDAFLEINCPRIPLIIQCMLPTFEPKSECLPSGDFVVGKLRLKGFESVGRYFCANNGEVIKNLIPNEGAKFILSNDEFFRCMRGIFSIYQISELCPLINTVSECIKGVGDDHPNAYLKDVGQHFLDEWRPVGNC